MLVWTISDQIESMRRNIFIAPGDNERGQLVLLGVLTNRSIPDALSDISKHAFAGDPLADKIIQFLHQQNTHGFHDAWERTARKLSSMKRPYNAHREYYLKRSATRKINATLAPQERAQHERIKHLNHLRDRTIEKIKTTQTKLARLEREREDTQLQHGLTTNTMARLERLRDRQNEEIRSEILAIKAASQ